MDKPEYIEALDECYDDPLMVEPLTWDTAIQDWQERARITRDLADRVADGKATASGFIASEYHLDGGIRVFSTSFAGCGVEFGVWECLWANIATCSSGLA